MWEIFLPGHILIIAGDALRGLIQKCQLNIEGAGPWFFKLICEVKKSKNFGYYSISTIYYSNKSSTNLSMVEKKSNHLIVKSWANGWPQSH
jgi:hypothetical protein